MMTDPTPAPGRSFGAVAAAYDRGRPGYPREAVEWLLGSPAAGSRLKVLELGAGTGKLTRTLVELGHDVFATDPDDAMLDVLSAHLPDVRATVGTAELVPVPDESVDVVIAAQAFHWFDPATALPEIGRVLKPGGHLALVWNQRDERIPWVRRLGRLIGKAVETIDPSDDLVESGWFKAIASEDFRHWQVVDRDSIVDLVLSRSNLIGLSEAEVEAKRAEVVAFYDDYGRGFDGMQLPYTAYCYRATVTDQRPARHVSPGSSQPTGSPHGAPSASGAYGASAAAAGDDDPLTDTSVRGTFASEVPLFAGSRNGLTDTAERLPAVLTGGTERGDDGPDTELVLIDFR